MRRALAMIAEPLALVGIVATLMWAAHTIITPVRVAGWSMSPALVPGDIVLVRLGARPITGDIVLVSSPGHQPVLHRVIELLDGGAVRTKGDANTVADFEPVPASDVAGRAVALLPVGAWLARWRGRGAYATMSSQPNSTRL